MSEFSSFYYNEQLKKYLIQFMAIFANMKVSVGKRDDNEPDLINVPIAMGSKDRVAAAIKSNNTQNKLVRLPMLSAHLSSIELAPELRKGVSAHRRNAYIPSGEVFPDGIQVVEQRQPVPYKGTFDLSMFVSNQDQHMQILEQILMLFEPNIQIQTSDDAFDLKRITNIELMGINFEENFPSGNERRMIQTTLNFTAPIYISAPSKVHDNYVKDIYTRIGAVSQASENSYDVIAELDQQGIDYNMIFSLDDVDIN